MQNEELQRKIMELEEWKKSLEASWSIPLNVDQAFRARLVLSSALAPSSKGATSETVSVISSVNFGAQTTTGASVLNNPDAYLQVQVGGITYYIPVFT